MHTLGKVFLWINLLFLVPAAVLLSAKLINSRNYWMQQIGQKEKQLENNREQIAQKEKRRSDLQSNLVRQRLAWDTMFLAPNSRADVSGVATVGVGPAQNFGVVPADAPAPIVHVFAPSENGSKYIGPFQIAEARGAQSRLQPMFRVFEGEPESWTPGVWRLWQVVPSQAPSRVVELTNEIVKAREAVVSRQETLALQQKAVEQAQQHLESRSKELLGDPQAPKIAGLPEVSEGLVAALRDAEAARNEDLAELNQLRHAVDQAYERLTRTVAQNERLAQQLAGRPAQLDVSSAR